MRESGDLVGGNPVENPRFAGKAGAADGLALDVIDFPAAGVETDARLAQAAMFVAVEINVGLERAFGIIRELPLVATFEVTNEDVGVTGPVADEDQRFILLIETRRREVKQLLVRLHLLRDALSFHFHSSIILGGHPERALDGDLRCYLVSTMRLTRSLSSGVVAYLSQTAFSASTNCLRSTSSTN